ncbi:MAG TPA: hypothetical protein VG055_03280 [Planctomycetaceae bacterium]|jgi:hypothetical protein|nr:hypothetical protein [Planctomycetaceae bacterium]
MKQTETDDFFFSLVPKLRLGTHFPEALLRGIMARMTRTRYRSFHAELPSFCDQHRGWLAPVVTPPDAVNVVTIPGESPPSAAERTEAN